MTETRRLRILVVEDEPLVAMLLEDMVADLGYEVIGPALRLEEAEALVEGERPDAAVLDVNLGAHRSYPLALRLAERGVPFAFATGYGSPGLEWDRDVPVLRKPFQQETVAALLAELLGQRAG